MNLSLTTKHYLWLGNFAILGLVVWFGVSLGMFILGQRLEEQVRAHGPISIDRVEVPKLQSLTHYEKIAEYNIFGGKNSEPEEADEGKSIAARDVQVTTQSKAFTLKGTIVDPEREFSAAILEDQKEKSQELFRPGDRVGDMELIKVARDSVTLKRGNTEIVLQIDMEDSKGPGFRPEKKGTGSKHSTRSDPSGKNQEGPVADSVGDNSYVVSRETLAQHMGNLSAFMSNVVIQPYFKEGKPYGYRIASVKEGSPIQELGLQRGDIIRKVNDVEVGKPEDLVNLYRQLQQLEQITVDIERGGGTQTLNYSLK